MPDSSDDSDDDVPLAQRAVAGEAPPPVPKPVVKSEPVKAPADPPKRKADASPTSPKKQKAPAAKPEVKAAVLGEEDLPPKEGDIFDGMSSIVRESLEVAAEIDVYTNTSIMVEEILCQS